MGGEYAFQSRRFGSAKCLLRGYDIFLFLSVPTIRDCVRTYIDLEVEALAPPKSGIFEVFAKKPKKAY